MENISNIWEVKEISGNSSEYKIDDVNIKPSEFNCSPFLISISEWYTLAITLGDRMGCLYTYKIVQAH